MTALDQTIAWNALTEHAVSARALDIKSLAEKSDRVRTLEDVTFDFTRHRVDARAMDLLFALARQQDVEGRFASMLAGAPVNSTEGRAAWHTALRDPANHKDVRASLTQIRAMAERLRTDASVRDIVHIGIGGSDIGPRLACRALAKDHKGPRVHFAANADGDDLNSVLGDLAPETTIVICASKTFSTQETMMNLRAARRWLGNDARMLAVTMNAQAAKAEGVADANILPLWDWVGGRFSVWSSIGTCIAIACGYDVFEEFLNGAHAADRHAATAKNGDNIPLTMALLTAWYQNFLGSTAHAVLPYAQRLALFTPYVQQLEMESNGKRVDIHGTPCAYATAPVVFGAAGTNVQHSFMQMIQQGPAVIPCDFIGVLDGIPNGDVVMANMQAQMDALTFGGGEGVHATLPGNRPSTAILLPKLNARTLGLLMAIWEHKTAMLGFLWNINSFDQFGVELGKTLARARLAQPLDNHLA